MKSARTCRITKRLRSRLASRTKHVVARCRRLLLLAEVGATGPDPEAALPQLQAARRALDVFIRLTRSIR